MTIVFDAGFYGFAAMMKILSFCFPSLKDYRLLCDVTILLGLSTGNSIAMSTEMMRISCDFPVEMLDTIQNRSTLDFRKERAENQFVPSAHFSPAFCKASAMRSFLD
jgi:hypothetical protein